MREGFILDINVGEYIHIGKIRMYKRKDEVHAAPKPEEQREERKGPPRRRAPPPPRGPRDETVVTINTVIPPMPVKHEILGKPNWEQHYELEFKTLRQEIERLKEEKVLDRKQP